MHNVACLFFNITNKNKSSIFGKCKDQTPTHSKHTKREIEKASG